MRETNPPLNLYLNDHFLRVARFHNGRQGKNKDWIFVLLMNRRKYEKSENIGFSSFCNSAAQLQACHERVVTVEGGASEDSQDHSEDIENSEDSEDSEKREY